MMVRLLSASMVLACLGLGCLALEGCWSAPGTPKAGLEVARPEAVVDFNTLYAQNCSACHGAKGSDGPSYPLANPEYQALVNVSILHRVVAEGEPGTSMPAFAASAGGTLTDAQIDALVAGMRAAWWKKNALAGLNPPPYDPAQPGNPAHGRDVYSADCASCHGGGGKAGSITDSDFLALVSDQALRTIVIAGRPDIGQPDWRGELPGRKPVFTTMTDRDVTDVVAWLSSQRPATSQVSPVGKQPRMSENDRGGLE